MEFRTARTSPAWASKPDSRSAGVGFSPVRQNASTMPAALSSSARNRPTKCVLYFTQRTITKIRPNSRNAPIAAAGTIIGSITRSGAAAAGAGVGAGVTTAAGTGVGTGVGSGVGTGLFARRSVYSHMAVHQALINSSEVLPPLVKSTSAMGCVV